MRDKHWGKSVQIFSDAPAFLVCVRGRANSVFRLLSSKRRSRRTARNLNDNDAPILDPLPLLRFGASREERGSIIPRRRRRRDASLTLVQDTWSQDKLSSGAKD